MSEFFVIFIIALLVFPPPKWPMVLYHLAKSIRWINTLKETFINFCKTHIQHYELEQNQRKANQADVQYKNNIPNS